MRTLLLLLIFMQSLTARADLVDDLASPVTTDAKWILLAGSGLTVAVIATQNSFSGPWETWTAQHRPLGKYSKYGDALGQMVPNALYVAGMLAASQFGFEKSLGRAWLMVEATAYASLVGQIMKMEISEGRPYYSQTGSSFPSGHTLTAFSFAGVVAAEHGWLYGTPAMAMAAFVGYSRINDNAHRLHDVVAGATIGLTCAYGLHYSHKAGNDSARIEVFPMPGAEGLAARWTF